MSAEDGTVRALLERRLGGPVASLQPIQRGEWSRAFRVDVADGRALIARFGAFDDDYRKDQRVMRFASDRLPVPRILEIGTALDGYVAISERIDGEFLDDLDAAAFASALPSLFEALDAAREADIGDTAGFGVWGIDGNAPHPSWHAALLDIPADRPTDRVHDWRPGLALAPTAARAFEAAWQTLQHLLPDCPNARHLVHSDLLNFNVLVADGRVSGVIDWGSSLYGDFVWDLAWLTFWQPWYAAWRDVDIVGAARHHYAEIGLDVPAFDTRLRCCELAIALDGMKYEAFTRRDQNLEWTAQRTLGIVART